MAKVTLTEAGGASEETVVPNLMTRTRMERNLEALRRERDDVEHTIEVITAEAETKELPVNQPLLDAKKIEIDKINEKIEDQIKAMQDLNKGINPETIKEERTVPE
jgi:hypothetical protein